MEEIRLAADVKDARIDAWLSDRLDKYSRSYIQKLICEGHVHVNGSSCKQNYRLKPGDDITVMIPRAEILDVCAENIRLDILYEDSDIIVVDKPKGMVVHPAVGNYSGTLVNALIEHCGKSLSDINGVIRPGIVHRIDKDTSGVLVVAKSNQAHEKLSERLKNHDIGRKYVAVVDGVIIEEHARIDAPVGRHPVDRKKMSVNLRNGRRAVTHLKVLERFRDATYIELTLETGRTHQIRVHTAYIGHPVAGDTVYGAKKRSHELNGQVLHAKTLGFIHPVKNEYMEFEADIPEYFKEFLKELRKNYGQ